MCPRRESERERERETVTERERQRQREIERERQRQRERERERERFAPLPVTAMKRNFALSGFSFGLSTNIHDWTKATHNYELFSAAEESYDVKDTYSRLSLARRLID